MMCSVELTSMMNALCFLNSGVEASTKQEFTIRSTGGPGNMKMAGDENLT